MADPTTVPDLRLWLKADSLASTTTDVTSWSNSAPGFTSESFAQTTAARVPTYLASAVNGLPGVNFDGVDDGLNAPASMLDLFRNIGGATVFAVARHDEPATTGTATLTRVVICFSRDSSTGSARLIMSATESDASANNDSMRIGGRRLDADGFQASFTPNDTWMRTEPRIVTAGWEWSAAALRGYTDGKLLVENLAFQTAGLTPDTNSMSGTIGVQSNNTQEFFMGPICEILVYKRLVTAAERAEVHTYLSDRYAISVADYPTTTYRPVSTIAAGGWTTTSTGLHVALSDIDPLTVIKGSGV